MPKKFKKNNNHKTNWRSLQSSRQSRKKVFLGIGALSFLLVVILVGKFIGFLGGINQPFAPDSPTDKKTYHWDGNSTLNLAVKADHLYVLSLDPVQKDIVLVKVPDETYLNLPMERGSWPARSIYNLGKDERPDIGASLVKLTLTQALAIPIDDYLIYPSDKEGFEDTVKNLKNGGGIIKFLQQSKTDMSFSEILKFLWDIRSIREDKFKVVDLAATPSTKWKMLSDGTRVLEIDSDNMDQFLSANFVDNAVNLEGLRIAVYNSTSHPLLAERAARMITNLGGHVSSVGSTSIHQDMTLVIGKPTKTFTRLSQIFNPDCLSSTAFLGLFSSNNCSKLSAKLSTQDGQFDMTNSRFEVIVVLGEDYYNKFDKIKN